MLGSAAVAMWWNVSPEKQAEWEEWHTTEHMPERLSIPGFLRGSRWIAQSGEPSYFMLYEAKDLAALTGPAYLERLNNPTPWSRQMMPFHLHMIRTVCVVRETYGAGVPHAMATIRLSASDFPELPRRKGVTAAHLLHAQPLTGAPTTEQRIRGSDASAEAVLLVGGYDADAVKRAAASAVPAKGVLGLYRLSYCLTTAG